GPGGSLLPEPPAHRRRGVRAGAREAGALGARRRRRAGRRRVQGTVLTNDPQPARRYLLADDTIDQRDLDELIEWLRTTPWLTMGPLPQEFERRWARWTGVEHAVFVNSGSSANLLMYYALLCSGRLRN